MFNKRFLIIIFVTAITRVGFASSENHTHLPFKGIALPDEVAARMGNAPIVGLYVGKGVWDTGREHLKLFFTEHGFGYKTFSSTMIINGGLENIRLLVMPGGESWEYLKELGEQGATKIRDWVFAGGNYIGICAGAFYATSHREGGVATGAYGIGILEGTAFDGTALEKEPFIEGMMDFDFFDHFLLTGFAKKFRIVMFGGPSFRYSEIEKEKKQISVLSEFQVIHEPAMILFRYGKGLVFLSGPHLEIEEQLTDWGEKFHDPDSEWPLFSRITRFVAGLP